MLIPGVELTQYVVVSFKGHLASVFALGAHHEHVLYLVVIWSQISYEPEILQRSLQTTQGVFVNTLIQVSWWNIDF